MLTTYKALCVTWYDLVDYLGGLRIHKDISHINSQQLHLHFMSCWPLKDLTGRQYLELVWKTTHLFGEVSNNPHYDYKNYISYNPHSLKMTLQSLIVRKKIQTHFKLSRRILNPRRKSKRKPWPLSLYIAVLPLYVRIYFFFIPFYGSLRSQCSGSQCQPNNERREEMAGFKTTSSIFWIFTNLWNSPYVHLLTLARGP